MSMVPMAARRASRRTSCSPPNGGACPSPRAVDHLGDERQLGRIAAASVRRLDLPGEVAAERGGGVAGEQFADLVELEQVEGVGVHDGGFDRVGFHERGHARRTPRAARVRRVQVNCTAVAGPSLHFLAGPHFQEVAAAGRRT